jgi:hypothetical protein
VHDRRGDQSAVLSLTTFISHLTPTPSSTSPLLPPSRLQCTIVVVIHWLCCLWILIGTADLENGWMATYIDQVYDDDATADDIFATLEHNHSARMLLSKAGSLDRRGRSWYSTVHSALYSLCTIHSALYSLCTMRTMHYTMLYTLNTILTMHYAHYALCAAYTTHSHTTHHTLHATRHPPCPALTCSNTTQHNKGTSSV